MLDNSYSMQYGDNFNRLKAEARSESTRCAPAIAWRWWHSMKMRRCLSRPTSDKNALKAAVDTLEPSFGGTRYYEAFVLADRVLSEFGGDQKQLVIISDFQRNGWNRSSRESVIGNDVKTETVNLGGQGFDERRNRQRQRREPTSFTRTYTGRLIARIHNYGKDKPVDVPVVRYTER